MRGVSITNPHAYRIVIGSNPESAVAQAADSRFVVMMSRINQMDPTSSENLDRFLRRYALYSAYYILPAVATGNIKDVEPI